LSPFGLSEKLRDINAAGVRIARAATGEHAFVAGAIGPLGVRIEPLGAMSFAEAHAAFREQAEALVEAGVDLLVLETFSNIDEIREAIFAAREVAGPEMVIVAQVTIDDHGIMPVALRRRHLHPSWTNGRLTLSTELFGGPKATFETIERMLQYSRKPMSAMPNAGLPAVVEGRTIICARPSIWRNTRAGCWRPALKSSAAVAEQRLTISS